MHWPEGEAVRRREERREGGGGEAVCPQILKRPERSERLEIWQARGLRIKVKDEDRKTRGGGEHFSC